MEFILRACLIRDALFVEFMIEFDAYETYRKRSLHLVLINFKTIITKITLFFI